MKVTQSYKCKLINVNKSLDATIDIFREVLSLFTLPLPSNAKLCTFLMGKQYNADLNASYCIIRYRDIIIKYKDYKRFT